MSAAFYDDDAWVDLWQRACVRDRAAWNQLCEQLRPVAWKKINRFQNLSYEDQCDVFSSVFLRLYTHIHTIEHPERLPGWVARTALNECYQMLRRRKRDAPTETVEDAPASGPSHDESVIADDRRRRVRAALSKLPARCQRILTLWSVETPQAVIAADVGLAVGSMGKTVRGCLDSLKRLLGGEEP